MSKKTQKLYLVDGNSLCYRAYYAIQNLSTSKGFPTGAIYGFLNMLKKLIKEYDPEMLAIVFDMAGPTTRHEKYEDYKVHRKPMPDDLVEQIPRIKDVIDAYNIPICQMQGYEADDIIATLAIKAKKKGLDVVIVTSDKDALQLVDDRIKVLSTHTSGDKVYGAKEVKEKFGVGPELMVDLMALTGDASDNIPGIKGVGQVTASKLITKWGSLKNVYENVEKVSSESLKKKLEEGREMAELSHELVQLDEKVPVKFDVQKAIIVDPDVEKLAELFKEFEFSKLLREIAPKEEAEVGSFQVVGDEKAAGEVIKKISKGKQVAFSISRSDDGGISGIALSSSGSESSFLPVASNKKLFQLAKEVLEDEKIKKIGYDLKEDIITLQSAGVALKGIDFDVMIADYLLDPSRTGYDLPDIAMRCIEYNLQQERGDMEWGKDGQASMDLSRKEESVYACERCDVIFRLYAELKGLLEKKELDSLFNDVEMPLVSVLAVMETEGVGIDTKYLKERSLALGKKLDKVSEKIFKLAGEEFNINSPKQLQVILFEKLGLPITKKTKTGASTDESVLRKLAKMHELPKSLIEYREMNKLKTGYYDSILDLVDEKKKRLHARFNQAVTATGRLSSSEPNLQNIPIKTPMGKEIRRAFIPGDKGKLILAADYSQVELRILAHLSGDENLIKAFKREEDVHKFTASLIFDCDLEEVTDEMRATAKTVNFGIAYGMSPFGLAKDLDISVDEAYKFIGAYFKRYAGISTFIDETIEDAKKKGFVTTLLNRRRYIPEITSPNERIRGFAERVAVNTPVQGSAADLIKLAMIDCHKEFAGTDVDMIIQVHDELVFEVPSGALLEAASKIKEIMEGVASLKVPLKVDVEAGENWLDLEEVKVSGKKKK